MQIILSGTCFIHMQNAGMEAHNNAQNVSFFYPVAFWTTSIM